MNDQADHRYVALLRGIAPVNPNMHNDKLRGLFDELGFTNVHTVISSGNVLFDSSSSDVQKLEATIEQALPKKLGFTSITIVRSREVLLKLIDANPFAGYSDAPSSRLNVTFLKHDPRTELHFPHQTSKGHEVLGLFDQAICSVIDLSGTSTPDVMAWLEKQFGTEITTRTWKTVNRIVSKFDQTQNIS